jgi:hypothetical protein
MKTLEHLKKLAYNSYRNISQDPDRRALQTIDAYSEELDADLEKIKSQGANDEQIERYKKGYEKHFTSWLSSQSNCASSFVCGPANFPVEKMRKRNAWADNHYNNFREFRTKVLNAYSKYEKKQKIEDAGGPLEIAKAKLKKLEDLQLFMKSVNKAHGLYLKNPQSLLNSDLSEYAQSLITGFVPEYSWIKHPFAPYQLSNNKATITNTKKRIEELESKENAISEGNKEIPFNGGVVIFNVLIDRLVIKHDSRPEPEVIFNLKKNGFKWSPFNKAWIRQLTDNAKISASRVLNIEIK